MNEPIMSARRLPSPCSMSELGRIDEQCREEVVQVSRQGRVNIGPIVSQLLWRPEAGGMFLQVEAKIVVT